VQAPCPSPNAMRWRRPGQTARTLRRITRLATSYRFTRRFDDSRAEFEVALRLNPNFSLAQAYYGLRLSYCGRSGRCEEAGQSEGRFV
jgi:tetratricopeptide (TPR) repeat protein